MSKKVYNLIFGIVTGVEAIAAALVGYFQPPMVAAIEAAIPIAGSAVISICKLFVKDE